MDYKQIIEQAFAGISFTVESYSHIYGITVQYDKADRSEIFDRLDKHSIPVIGATETTVTIPKR
jgi:hypothetical protein